MLEPRAGVTFVPSYLFEDLHDLKVDLAINTLSFSEMSAATVGAYARVLKTMLGHTGVLFEQNLDMATYTDRDNFCNPKLALERYFAVRRDLECSQRAGEVPIGLGQATLWSNPTT